MDSNGLSVENSFSDLEGDVISSTEGANFETTNIVANNSGADFEIYFKLGGYYVVTLIIVGIVGNAISFILFLISRQLKRVPSSQYLAALSFTDLTFVSCLSLIYLKSVGVNWQDSTIVCPLSIYLSNTSCLLSGWFIMALTAEMALAIVDPYRARRYCSRGLVAKRITAITCFGCLINIWTLIIARSVPIAVDIEPTVDIVSADLGDSDSVNGDRLSNETKNRSIDFDSFDFPSVSPPLREIRWDCSYHPEHEEYYNNLTIFDSVISFSIPLLITLALNITIGFVLLRSLTKRQKLMERKFSKDVVASSSIAVAVSTTMSPKLQLRKIANEQDQDPSDSGTSVRRNGMSPLLHTKSSNRLDCNGRNRGQRRSRMTLVSSLLVTKSLIYLTLNLPNYVHRLWQMTRGAAPDDEAQYQKEKLVQLLVYLLFYTQYSLNFFIYSMHACKTACRPSVTLSSASERRTLRVV